MAIKYFCCGIVSQVLSLGLFCKAVAISSLGKADLGDLALFLLK